MRNSLADFTVKCSRIQRMFKTEKCGEYTSHYLKFILLDMLFYVKKPRYDCTFFLHGQLALF